MNLCSTWKEIEMTFKQITCYQTEDGRIWQTLAQAELWETVTAKIVEAPAKESEPEYNHA